VLETLDGGLDGAAVVVARCTLSECFASNAILLCAECVGDVIGGEEVGFWECFCRGRMWLSWRSWTSLSVNGVALLARVVYLLGCSRKKKAMQAMSAVARAPGSMDVAAMSMVVRRILRGMGWTWFRAGSEAWKPGGG